MTLLIRFIRIYTPFICTVMALLNGVFLKWGVIPEDFTFLGAATSGYSIVVVMYFFATSLRMCKWYHLNLLCLLFTQFCGIAYKYLHLEFTMYVNAVILLCTLGIMFFLVFRTFYKVTVLFLCTHIDSPVQK